MSRGKFRLGKGFKLVSLLLFITDIHRGDFPMENLSLRLTSKGPGFLMHNVQLADPLNEFVKRIAEVSKKRGKTESDHMELGRLEFLGSLYLGADGPVIPAQMITACLRNAAKRRKLGTLFGRSVFAVEHAYLEYDGPRTPKELWEDSRFSHRASVVVQTSRCVRTRPLFVAWSATVKIGYIPEEIDRDVIVQVARDAGEYVGIGDWRPAKAGPYGRFNVAEISV